MADKTIGDLPQAAAFYDNDLFLLEQSGTAKNRRGALLKAYLKGFVDSASAASEEAAAALAGVREAIDNIPEGVATPIVNDLTTGGTSMALSAEQGKVLKGEIDEVARNAMPLDGSKAMTGQLQIDTSIQGKGVIVGGNNQNSYFASIGSGGVSQQRTMQIRNEDTDTPAMTALQYAVWTAGKSVNFPILHTGNKPSGSYTGNGDATERRIEMGGLSDGANGVMISSTKGMAIVGPKGAIGKLSSSASVAGISISECEKLTAENTVKLRTTNELLNANGVTYYYKVF